MTHLNYDRPLQQSWGYCMDNVRHGEFGSLEVPVHSIDTVGRYSLMSVNTEKLQKTIYAATEVTQDYVGPYFEFFGKRCAMIAVADMDTADKLFWLWETARLRGEDLGSATLYMLEKLHG